MIRAIETKFDGRFFRSRAEARWAAFFRALGLAYEYEPEGYALPSGRGYLPDFRLHLISRYGRQPILFEIKGALSLDNGKLAEAVRAFDAESMERGAVLPTIEAYAASVKNVSRLGLEFASQLFWKSIEHNCTVDSPGAFCVCECCGTVGFEPHGNAGNISCCFKYANGDGLWRGMNFDTPTIQVAINEALSERFGT